MIRGTGSFTSCNMWRKSKNVRRVLSLSSAGPIDCVRQVLGEVWRRRGVTCGPVSLSTSGGRYQSPSEIWAVSCCAYCLSGSWESWRANSELITHNRRSTNIGRDAPYLPSLLISLEQADVRMLSLILCWCQPRSVSAGLYHAEYITDTQPSSRVRHLPVMRVTKVLC